MNWQTKMLYWGWKPTTRGGYEYKQKVNGRKLTIPAHMAKTWESWGLVPTLQGVKSV